MVNFASAVSAVSQSGAVQDAKSGLWAHLWGSGGGTGVAAINSVKQIKEKQLGKTVTLGESSAAEAIAVHGRRPALPRKPDCAPPAADRRSQQDEQPAQTCADNAAPAVAAAAAGAKSDSHFIEAAADAAAEAREIEALLAAKATPAAAASEERQNEANSPRKQVFLSLDLQGIVAEYKERRETFQVAKGFKYVRGLGRGAYGMVAEFTNETSEKALALKKVGNAFDDLNDGKRILREVKLLQSFNHENIVQLVDLYTEPCEDFDDIYIVTELMQMDLSRVIRSGAELSENHQCWFTYQMLRGVYYLHSAGVVHRDLKPGNLLVNKDCTLKICDFGLARGGAAPNAACMADEENNMLTEYVVTRYYRAPEVVLLAAQYGPAIDIWAVGCILCELISRKPLFRGKDYMDQIRKIFEVLGAPSESDIKWLSSSQSAVRFVSKFSELEKVEWADLFPESSPRLLETLDCMIRLNPADRKSAKQCMRLPFFEDIYMQEDEVEAEALVDWSFDAFEPTREELQRRIHTECFKHPTFSQALLAL